MSTENRKGNGPVDDSDDKSYKMPNGCVLAPLSRTGIADLMLLDTIWNQHRPYLANCAWPLLQA
jgi:hypothetical protein